MRLNACNDENDIKNKAEGRGESESVRERDISTRRMGYICQCKGNAIASDALLASSSIRQFEYTISASISKAAMTK